MAEWGHIHRTVQMQPQQEHSMAQTMRLLAFSWMEAAPYFGFADAQGSGLIHMSLPELDLPFIVCYVFCPLT